MKQKMALLSGEIRILIFIFMVLVLEKIIEPSWSCHQDWSTRAHCWQLLPFWLATIDTCRWTTGGRGKLCGLKKRKMISFMLLWHAKSARNRLYNVTVMRYIETFKLEQLIILSRHCGWSWTNEEQKASEGIQLKDIEYQIKVDIRISKSQNHEWIMNHNPTLWGRVASSWICVASSLVGAKIRVLTPLEDVDHIHR